MMPYVPVPKDLGAIKTKVAFGLTKRQIICFASAAAVGVPVFFLTKGALGNEAAVLLMIGLMLPFFFLAMYEKNGLTPEKIARNYIRTKYLSPGPRPYKTKNMYAYLEKKEETTLAEKAGKASAAGKTAAGKRSAGKKQ